MSGGQLRIKFYGQSCKLKYLSVPEFLKTDFKIHIFTRSHMILRHCSIMVCCYVIWEMDLASGHQFAHCGMRCGVSFLKYLCYVRKGRKQWWGHQTYVKYFLEEPQQQAWSAHFTYGYIKGHSKKETSPSSIIKSSWYFWSLNLKLSMVIFGQLSS